MVNYPTARNLPHFEVTDASDGEPAPITGKLYRDRADAEAEYVDLVLEGGWGNQLKIVQYDVVYYLHCVVCGQSPSEQDQPYPEWCWVLEELPNHYGWAATDEQLVFCPNHGPSKED